MVYNRAAPSRSRSVVSGFDSVIGSGMRINGGELVSHHDTRIDGMVKAPVDIRGHLMITDSAEINGDIEAEVVTIAGIVRGSVEAIEVNVMETGKVYGNITAQELSTNKGAFIDGKIIMPSNEQVDTAPDSNASYDDDDDDDTDNS